PRPVQAAAGATRAEGPEEGQVSKPAPVFCEADACRVRTSPREFRAARELRHPVHVSHMHTTNYSRGKARARPSGPEMPEARRRFCRAGDLTRAGLMTSSAAAMPPAV